MGGQEKVHNPSQLHLSAQAFWLWHPVLRRVWRCPLVGLAPSMPCFCSQLLAEILGRSGFGQEVLGY